MNFSQSCKKILKDCKQGIYSLRNEPGNLEKLRTFAMTFFVCAAVSYAFYSSNVEPIDKKISKKKNELIVVDSSAPLEVHEMLTSAYQKLSLQKNEIDKKIAMMELQHNVFKEKWQAKANEHNFSKLILSRMPASQQRGIEQMVKLEPEKKDNYEVLPLSLEGETSYDSLFNYIVFLERQPGVGVFDSLIINSKNNGNGGEDQALSYSLKVGMIKLDSSI